MRSTILLLLSFATTSELAAQKVVRWTSNGSTRQAAVESIAPDGKVAVQLGRGAPSTILSPDTIPDLSLRTGGANARGTNALIGMALGAAIGGVAGYASGDDQCGGGWFGCVFTFTAEQKAGMGAATGGLLGLLIGAVAAPAARWVPWEKSGTVARIRPTGGVNVAGDPKLGLQISF